MIQATMTSLMDYVDIVYMFFFLSSLLILSIILPFDSSFSHHHIVVYYMRKCGGCEKRAALPSVFMLSFSRQTIWGSFLSP